MRITNSQKNELSDIFRKSGLNILDFETSGQFKEFKVKFKHQYFSFSINIRERDQYFVTIFPINNTNGYNAAGNWEQIKGKFKVWCEELYNELNTPTGWETFQSTNYLNTNLLDLEEKFSEKEKIQTRQSILELKNKVKTLSIPETSITAIDKKLNDLSLKVDELNKFDWKSLFIGSIANFIMTLAIPPQASGLLWEYIKTAFTGLKLEG